MEIIGFPLEASNSQLDNFQKLDNFHWIISSSKLTALQFLDFRHVDILVYWRQSFRHLCYPEKVQICAFCITDSDSVIQIMFDWCIICYIPWWCFIMIIPSFVLYHDYDPSLMHHHIICFYHGLTSKVWISDQPLRVSVLSFLVHLCGCVAHCAVPQFSVLIVIWTCSLWVGSYPMYHPYLVGPPPRVFLQYIERTRFSHSMLADFSWIVTAIKLNKCIVVSELST
jgi:hypothetical protein